MVIIQDGDITITVRLESGDTDIKFKDYEVLEVDGHVLRQIADALNLAAAVLEEHSRYGRR